MAASPAVNQWSVVRESMKRRLSRCSWEPAGNKLRAKAKKSPLLEAVARKRLVKIVTG
jgi:hypothetical protein